MEYNKRFVNDGSAWMRHLQAMSKGEMNGGRKFYRLKSDHSKPVPMRESVKVVSESEQTMAQAKEELKDESERGARKATVTRPIPTRNSPSKRAKSVLLKESFDDIFSI